MIFLPRSIERIFLLPEDFHWSAMPLEVFQPLWTQARARCQDNVLLSPDLEWSAHVQSSHFRAVAYLFACTSRSLKYLTNHKMDEQNSRDMVKEKPTLDALSFLLISMYEARAAVKVALRKSMRIPSQRLRGVQATFM